jgi:Domain of unknown function (DUF4440)
LKPHLWLPLLLLAPVAARAAECPTQPRTESALLQAEHTWAEVLEKKDAPGLACLLAPNFEDAGPDGSLTNREQTLAHVASHRPGSNHLSEMIAHVYGNLGYTRGLATLLDPQGKQVAQVRFTDIFLYEHGRWQALAGQETLIKPAK